MSRSPLSTSESSPKSLSVSGAKARRTWTPAEDAILKALVGHYGDTRGPEGSWKETAASISNRTAKDCRKRWFHSLDPSLRKGRWTAEEDKVLLEAYARLGPAWHDISVLIPGRKDDQCSKRYNDILNPSAKNRLVDWTTQEDELLRQGVQALGHRWSAISSRIPGRPPLTCRNRWRALSKKAQLGRGASKRSTPSLSASQISPGDNSDSPGSHGVGVNVESSNGNVTLDDLPCGLLNSSLGDGDESDANFLNAALYDSFSGSTQAGIHLQIPDTDRSHASLMLDGVTLDNSDGPARTPRPDWDQSTRPSNNNPLARLRHPSGGRNSVTESSTWPSISSLDYNATPSPTNPPSIHHVWPGPPPLPPDPQFWELLGDDFTSATQKSSSRFYGPSHQVIHVHHHYHYHITKSVSGPGRHSTREQGQAQREGVNEHT